MHAAQIALASVGKQVQQLPLRWCAKSKPNPPMEPYRCVATKKGANSSLVYTWQFELNCPSVA